MTTPNEESVVLNVGDTAPTFSLPAHPSGTITLEDYRGKNNVILAFYPKDDTPGCTKEMCTFSDRREEFAAANTVILGISTDDTDSHERFALKHSLANELLSDRSREVGLAYGAIHGDRNMADRMLFVIDKNGLIRHIHSGMPDFDEILSVVQTLESLQSRAK